VEPTEAAFTLQERIDGIRKWMELNAPEVSGDQKHLNEGTIERSYWHHGYMVALRDARNLLLGFNITPGISTD